MNVFCTKCGSVVLDRVDKRQGKHSNNHDCRTAPEWCNAKFGGPYTYPDPTMPGGERRVENRWQCRLPKGHEGPHDCRSARDVGYVLVPDQDAPTQDTLLKPRARSAAARAVFGG